MKAMFRAVVEVREDVKYRPLEAHEIQTFPLTFVYRDGVDPDGWAHELVGELTREDVEAFNPTPLIMDELYEVFGTMSCHAEQHWTDCGYEYDSWAEFSELQVRQLTPQERDFFISLNTEDEKPETDTGDLTHF